MSTSHFALRWTRRLFWIVLSVLVLWAVSGAIFTEVSLRPRHRFAHPSPAVEAAVRQESKIWDDVSIKAADGAVLRAWFLMPRTGEQGCVMVLHGVVSSRASGLGLARMFEGAGYSVLLPDARGQGDSGGSMVTYGILERGDTLRWADWLRARGCTRLFGIGASMGASVLIQAAAEAPVFRAIVAECPFSDLRTVAEDRIMLRAPLPRLLTRPLADALVPMGFVYARLAYGLDLNEVSPVESAAHLRTPLLLIHGLADVKIPPAHSRAIAAAAPSAELWLVPGAKHIAASIAAPEEYRRRVLGWFAAHAAP
jgi:dipeptidyl aminopeptidase/acylaminoacyl peptidase